MTSNLEGLRAWGSGDAHAVTAVCIKLRGGAFPYAGSETVPSDGAVMLIDGGVEEVKRFVSAASK